MSEQYRHYYGVCEDDNVIVQIEIHPDAGKGAVLPNQQDWEDFGLRCPVCGNTVPSGYEGADDFTTDDERTARFRAERRARDAEAALSKVSALVTSPEAEKYRGEACRGTVQLPYANNRYIRLLDDVRDTLTAPTEARATRGEGS